jgi:hypothetical protein
MGDEADFCDEQGEYEALLRGEDPYSNADCTLLLTPQADTHKTARISATQRRRERRRRQKERAL